MHKFVDVMGGYTHFFEAMDGVCMDGPSNTGSYNDWRLNFPTSLDYWWL